MNSASRDVRLRLSRIYNIDDCHLSAHDVALSKQHKSISASDVLKALEIIEFGDLVDPLQNELQSNSRLSSPFDVSQPRTVYRENTKGDKNRKSAVDRNNISNKGKAKEGESISSASRPKGKGKAALPPPFTTLPLPAASSSLSHSTEDVNMNVATGENGDVGEAEGGADYDSGMADEVDDSVPYPYEEIEEEELMDFGPNEVEEPRKDAAGLDDVDRGED